MNPKFKKLARTVAIMSVFSKNDTLQTSSQSSNKRVERRNAEGYKASEICKLGLSALRDSADVFPPLKSTAGGIVKIIELCEVCLLLYSFIRSEGINVENRTLGGGRQL